MRASCFRVRLFAALQGLGVSGLRSSRGSIHIYVYIYIYPHTHKHIRVPSFLKLSSLGLDVVSRKAEAQTESKEDGSARHQALRKM